MNYKIKIIGLLVFVVVGRITYGQTNKEKALLLGKEAIELMDNGNIDESIKLLEEAQKRDKGRFEYRYELAYAHFLKKDFNGVIKILENNKGHKNVTPRLFQLLGNTYDIMGKSDKAFEVYDEGLKKFPNSGMIYLEKGNVYWGKQELNKALPYYEKGIELDPQFPSNYYRAALIYFDSYEEVWGMIYGEIFMNLERNSKRTAEMSQLLYETYKSEIKFINDTSMTVSFCKQITMNINDITEDKPIKLPFCMVYEPTLILALVTEKNVDLNSLDRIRENFINVYFERGFNKTYPNVLFDYQKKLIKEGQFEAYNHWLLMKGDEAEFIRWEEANNEKWVSFTKWFTDNGLKIGEANKFYRTQY
jgi:tetratricopeptide (TPR) repeat protein